MIFTLVMKPVATLAHRKGIRLHQYIDNWLCAARTTDQLPTSDRFKVRIEGKSREVGSHPQHFLPLPRDCHRFGQVPCLSSSQKNRQSTVAPQALPAAGLAAGLEVAPVTRTSRFTGEVSNGGKRRLWCLQFQLKENWKHPQDKNRLIFVSSECRLSVHW